MEWVLDDAASVGAAHIDGNYKVRSRQRECCVRSIWFKVHVGMLRRNEERLDAMTCWSASWPG